MPSPLTEAEALGLLRAHFGVSGALERLPGELDDNFLVEEASGARSILKVVEAGGGPERVRPQVEALEHLRAKGFESVPRVLPTPAGHAWVEVAEGPEAGRVVWRLSWLEGRLLAESEPSAATFRALGGRLAELDRALGDLTSRGIPTEHYWDPAHPEWLAGHLGALPDEARRAIVERVLAEVESRLRPRRGLLRPGVIHADANDYNVLVDAQDPARIVGLFDFGDMMHTARVCEPAIAAAYAAMHTEDPAEGIVAVLSGYHAVAPLDPVELEVAFTLVRARLAISVVTSAERAGARPDDAYVTVSEAGAWRVLEALDGRDADELTGELEAACPPPTSDPALHATRARLRARRAARMGGNLSLSYREPIHAVRGWMQYLYDEEGRAYLDLYNNVPHVGHSHPHVAEAIARQSATLATNTRYLSALRLDYIERLAGLFPYALDTVFLVNSASEANDLALRIARAATGRRDVVVQEGAYHGHTTSLIDISPYKAEGPGGDGVPDRVHTVPCPDPYRGVHRGPESGPAYAAEVVEVLDRREFLGRPVGALFAETFPSVAGQIVPPEGYLAAAADAVRARGGLFVADEVQTGFGRLGETLWGFEVQGATPDLVVLGKPMGNGFPIGAVVTTRAIADAFDTGMEFFSTFGGNPVACAAGDAMLDVLFDEGLPARAASLGGQLIEGLRALQPRHPWMGDVRGMGLFLGVECVTDPETRAPDPGRARAIVEALREAGILTGTDGPEHNVVKLRGPLVLADRDAQRLVEAWEAVADERR
jgi:4-aminobutyrate aminotransferase-like enzyme/Ser/Thr protein kinase RdoA (MazF antagonist)